MAGYQGWFNAPDDGADASTTDLHFKWMKQYGIDGVFVQRFIGSTRGGKSLRHNDKVLAQCLEASRKYNRAIAVMYDLSGMKDDDTDPETVIRDWRHFVDSLKLTARGSHQTYLYHNGHPLVAVWGVGFPGRPYGLKGAEKIIDFLKKDPVYGGCAVLLGVPTYWRTLDNDAIKDPQLHDLLRKADIVQPWFVGRYNKDSYPKFKERVADDIRWCTQNKLDYVPVGASNFVSPEADVPEDYYLRLAGEAGRLLRKEPASFVDPLIGSGGHGHVFVGASVPFGAVQLGPENFYKGWDWCSGYNYRDSVLIGFAHTHLSGTGIGDLGDILIMPYTGSIKTDKGVETIPGSGYASRYSHTGETARPGYYAVTLDDYHIRAELTASERVGFHQYHFPTGGPAHVIIDLKEGINDQPTETQIHQIDATTFEGFRRSKGWAKDQIVFFAIKTSVAIDSFQTIENKGLFNFTKAPAILQLKVGISPVSATNALANINAEIPGWDFDATAEAARQAWNRELSKVELSSPKPEPGTTKLEPGTTDEKNRRIFYTALYHTMIDPALFNDANGDYRGADKQVYHHADFANYSVFSLWDTYRAENPLLTILQPRRVSDMIRTMLDLGRKQKLLPIWHLMANETGTMVGVSSLQIIAEAWLKGIKGINPDSAWQAIRRTALSDTLGWSFVREGKPIPADQERRSVARAMEYAIGEGSIALMAKKLGNEKDYQFFRKRARDYQLYYDKSTGFFRGIPADSGHFSTPFDPFKTTPPWSRDYAEGNAWQYLWLAPQDVKGLMTQLGGEQRFLRRLDSFFIAEPTIPDTHALADITGTIGQYAHGNEPSHHIAYLYAYAGHQWQTAEKTRYILTNMYHDDPDGVIGNEDCGQMSAWYVFSALGFYPVFPASGVYVMGSPLFDKAVLHLDDGKTFTIITTDNGPDNKYIQSMTLDEKPYPNSYILHQDILRGGTLKIKMGPQPNPAFGQTAAQRPPDPLNAPSDPLNK
jgi:predicted alpha-1,2-mannosidase